MSITFMTIFRFLTPFIPPVLRYKLFYEPLYCSLLKLFLYLYIIMIPKLIETQYVPTAALVQYSPEQLLSVFYR